MGGVIPGASVLTLRLSVKLSTEGGREVTLAVDKFSLEGVFFSKLKDDMGIPVMSSQMPLSSSKFSSELNSFMGSLILFSFFIRNLLINYLTLTIYAFIKKIH